MKQEILKGMAIGLVCILITVAIGMSIGFACSGGEYEVDPPEEAERVGQLGDDSQPMAQALRG